MPEVYATGSWRPKEGREEAFVEAWCEFARWMSELDGAGTVRLTRDLRDPGRYVSFSVWASFNQMRAWKDLDEFRPRMAKVQEHVAEFTPTELEVVAAIEHGAAVSAR